VTDTATAPVYVVADTPDGRLLSWASGTPDDTTMVWEDGEPDSEAVPLAQVIAHYGANKVDLYLEPEPYQPGVTAAAGKRKVKSAADEVGDGIGGGLDELGYWHDPNSGRFAPKGFVSKGLLRKLLKGDGAARTELLASFDKKLKEAADGWGRGPHSRENRGMWAAKVLGERPSEPGDDQNAWDLANREFSSWLDDLPELPEVDTPDKVAPDVPQVNAALPVPPKVDGVADITPAWNVEAAKAISRGDIRQEQLTSDYGLAPWQAESVAHDISNGQADRFDPLPDTLYHVTTNLSAVKADGALKSRADLGVGSGSGLGGGTDHAISLTTDRATADLIRDQILEARAVARGDITAADLFERAKTGDGGSAPFYDNLVAVEGSDLSRFDDPQKRLGLYQTFAMQRGFSGGPRDMFITGVKADDLANLDPNNVGIVTVSPKPGTMGVDLKDPIAHEWRVPDGSVLNIDSTDSPDAFSHGVGHTPTYGPSAAELINDTEMMPANWADHPERYGTSNPGGVDETMAALRSVDGNPDATVTIYRAVPSDVADQGKAFGQGDWVTLSRSYAEQHAASNIAGGPGVVVSEQVPADSVRYAGDDLMEWGYFPDGAPQEPDTGNTDWEKVAADRDARRAERSARRAAEEAARQQREADRAASAGEPPKSRFPTVSSPAMDRPEVDTEHQIDTSKYPAGTKFKVDGLADTITLNDDGTISDEHGNVASAINVNGITGKVVSYPEAASPAASGSTADLSKVDLTPDLADQVTAGDGTKANPFQTTDVQTAAALIAQKQHVQLAHERQVSTLVDKLDEMVKEAVAAGADAPKYDLCLVSVPGTNLFCADNKGIERIHMPQFSSPDPLPGTMAASLPRDDQGWVNVGDQFVDYVRSTGVTVTDERINPSMLKASQAELDGAKVAAIYRDIGVDPNAVRGTIFVSSDDYVVDGHHRWAAQAAYALANGDGAADMDIQRIDMPITELLALANAYTAEVGIPGASVFSGPEADPGDIEKIKAAIDKGVNLPDADVGLRFTPEAQGFRTQVEEAVASVPGFDRPYDRAAALTAILSDLALTDSPLDTHVLENRLGPNGDEWTPERQALHQQIIDDIISQVEGKVPKERRAVIMAGLPGAGKSTALQPGGPAAERGFVMFEPGTGDIPDGVTHVVVNPDLMKEALIHHGAYPHVEGLKPMETVGLTHEESSYLSKALWQRLIDEGYNVALDGTLVSRGGVQKKVQQLVDRGYDERVGINARITLDGSRRSALDRYARGAATPDGGRLVPPQTWDTAAPQLPGAASSVDDNFDAMLADGLFTDGVVVDNRARLATVIPKHTPDALAALPTDSRISRTDGVGDQLRRTSTGTWVDSSGTEFTDEDIAFDADWRVDVEGDGSRPAGIRPLTTEVPQSDKPSTPTPPKRKRIKRGDTSGFDAEQAGTTIRRVDGRGVPLVKQPDGTWAQIGVGGGIPSGFLSGTTSEWEVVPAGEPVAGPAAPAG